jgi:ABC-2 type transport system ATP-binding protein
VTLTLEIRHVVKRYGDFTAVNDISFSVSPGRIFGFLGTNGAGKTTTMRMILDILRPDSGSITWNGIPNVDVPRRDFGYLPEERGLYPRMPVDEHLLFLARLYGADAGKAARDLTEWLERLDITENRRKRIEQLSKGNQQKIQFLAAILHDPEILILDEPFSGLDPVNAEQMRGAFLELRDRGKTIIFSTHQLNDAQQLCHDVAIIHRGNLLISGDVPSVRRSTGTQVVRFAVAGYPEIAWLPAMPGVEVVGRNEEFTEFTVPDETAARAVLTEAVRRGDPVVRFEIDYPSLNDVFLSSVRGLGEEPGNGPAQRVPLAAGARREEG